MNILFWQNRLATNKVIRTLTFNDISYWGGFDMAMVIFALYVVDRIPAATAADVGISMFIYKATSTFASIPIGAKLDSIKGMKDEAWGLCLSGLITGTSYLLLTLITNRYHLFGLMLMLGLGRSLNLSSWRTLFNKWVDRNRTSITFSIYETVFGLGTGLLVVAAGVASSYFGYQSVLIASGLLVIGGSFLPLLIRQEIADYSGR